MTVRPQRYGSHHVQLLWVAILAIALITFFADALGWFHVDW